MKIVQVIFLREASEEKHMGSKGHKDLVGKKAKQRCAFSDSLSQPNQIGCFEV